MRTRVVISTVIIGSLIASGCKQRDTDSPPDPQVAQAAQGGVQVKNT